MKKTFNNLVADVERNCNASVRLTDTHMIQSVMLEKNVHMHFGICNKVVIVATTAAAADAQFAPNCVLQTKEKTLNKSRTRNIERKVYTKIISLHSSINIYFLLVNIDSILNH